MTRRYKNTCQAMNVLADYILLNLSLIIVYNISHHSFYYWLGDKTYLHVVTIFNLLWLLAANLIGLYSAEMARNSYLSKSIKTYVLYILLVFYFILILNKIESYFITREFLYVTMSVFGVLFTAWKILFIKKIVHSSVIHGPLRRTIIVGGGNYGAELYNRLSDKSIKGYQLIGLFDDNPGQFGDQEFYLGSVNECIAFSLNNDIDEILCALPSSDNRIIEHLIQESDKNLIRFKLIPEQYEYFQGALTKQSITDIEAFSIRLEPLESIINGMAKRVFDILFSLFVIVFVLSWLYPIIYILIKLESPGPVLFVQPRSGRNNAPFNCLKFRSMHVNNDANKQQATKGDKRITKIGAFLRKSSLDEMPQFFNVLMGEMSVVGPRPHMLTHTREYSVVIDQFMVRHFVKPGITGWAQIQGLRGETKMVEDMRARVDADLWYIENWTFSLDLKIIFSTFFKTIAGDKYAY